LTTECNCPEGDPIKAYNESSGESTLQIVPESVVLAANLRAFPSALYLLTSHVLTSHVFGRATAPVAGVR